MNIKKKKKKKKLFNRTAIFDNFPRWKKKKKRRQRLLSRIGRSYLDKFSERNTFVVTKRIFVFFFLSFNIRRLVSIRESLETCNKSRRGETDVGKYIYILNIYLAWKLFFSLVKNPIRWNWLLIWLQYIYYIDWKDLLDKRSNEDLKIVQSRIDHKVIRCFDEFLNRYQANIATCGKHCL